MDTTKPFTIPKSLVWNAWKSVKANAGSAGVDRKSIENFEMDLKDNLFKLWNRMSSGTYFPPPVMGVEIPKKAGGVRVLGVPTVEDRIAQTTAKLFFEPSLEKEFLPDSYGYRAGKSAHDAIATTRKRCWKCDWIIEFDIVGLFDNIPHELLLKAFRHHVNSKWVNLYIKRWLKVSMKMPDGRLVSRNKGTPQGGVVGPVLSNLFLHYTFDKWMERNFPSNQWCRYADDGLIHCKTLRDAKIILATLKNRFEECGLKLHETKTKIVYCKDSSRKGNFPNKDFTFLGFHFRARLSKNKFTGGVFSSFSPAVHKETLKEMRRTIKYKWKLRLRSHCSLDDLAKTFNPIIRGWFQYYTKFYRIEMLSIARYLNEQLGKWARRKFKKLRRGENKMFGWLKKVYDTRPQLFAHWLWLKVY